MLIASGAGFVPVHAADHSLARSKRLGVEIDAVGGSRWCQEDLTLAVRAQNKAVYETVDFSNLIKKLGQVLRTECPQAKRARIRGFGPDFNLVYQGVTNASNGWLVAKSAPTLPQASTGSGMAASSTNSDNVLNELMALKKEAVVDNTSASKAQPNSQSVDNTALAELEGLRSSKIDVDASPSAVRSNSNLSPVTATPNDGGLKVRQVEAAGDSFPVEELAIGSSGSPSADETSTNSIRADFAVGNFQPDSSRRSFFVAPNMREYDVPIKNMDCRLRYAREPNKSYADLYTAVATDLSCRDGYVHGTGTIRVLGPNGGMKSFVQGGFTDGYMTVEGPLPLSTFARFTSAISPNSNEVGLLAVLASTDEAKSTYYAPLLTSRRGRWSACRAPAGLVLTAQKEIVQDNAAIRSVTMKMGQGVLQLCPNADEFALTISEKIGWGHKDASGLLYQATIKRLGNEWQISPESVRNYVQMELAERRKEEARRREAEYHAQRKQWRQGEQAYKKLKSMRRVERVAYALNFRLENVATTASLGLVRDTPQKIASLVHVVDVKSDDALATWPFHIKLVEGQDYISSEGWYVVWGRILADRENTQNEIRSATLVVNEAYVCELNECAEFDDRTKAVRTALDMPDWDYKSAPKRETEE